MQSCVAHAIAPIVSSAHFRSILKLQPIASHHLSSSVASYPGLSLSWVIICWPRSNRHRRPVADAVGNDTVPIQLAQCWFPRVAISNAGI